MSILSSKKHTPHPGSKEFSERVRNIGHDPHIDWMLILILSAVIGVLLVAIGVLTFQKVEGLISQPAQITPNSASSINPEMLTHTLGQFEARARERAELIKMYRGPVDPSI